ncbi:MAG TPA: DUF1080 domain-containing protein [Planctomycetota bacterium]|nr:DUF1080 domain-containing protein [Planctomycetota bacterium]
MKCCLFWVVVIASLAAAVAFAGAPPESEVQGLYEGFCKDAKGESKLEARVVAMGKKAYKLLVRDGIGEKSLAKLEMDGATDANAIGFAGKAGDVIWEGKYAAGAIAGTFGDGGTFELKRVERKSPTLGAKPPEGAVVLLDGKSFEQMVRANSQPWYVGDKSKEGCIVWEVALRAVAKQPAAWPTKETPLPEGWELMKDRRQVDVVLVIGEDGSVQVPRGGMNSRQQFDGSFKAHVEFCSPLLPDGRGQGRGNSGVYLPNGDEIQVLDSFGMPTYTGGGCGGVYRYQDPACMADLDYLKGKDESKFTLASLPPGEWQAYDIQYRVEVKDGKPVGKPRLTLRHNGIAVHSNFELRNAAKKGSFHFQDHGNPVRYRNIWVQPMQGKAGEL